MYTANHKNLVLLTGASGFLGKIIKDNLTVSGYTVRTLGRLSGNDIRCDLSREIPQFEEQYDWIVHNAGKAHIVPRTHGERQEFFDVNCTGTANLLTGFERSGKFPRSIVFISSVSVYGLTRGESIDESQALSASDPYGKSKIEAEAILHNWCSNHPVGLTILRLPLLAGKMPPGNLGAMIKGIRSGLYLRIAGNTSRKSMVMAEDVAAILPSAAETPGIYNLTDGYHPSFFEIEQVIAKQEQVKRILTTPLWVGRLLGYAGDIVDKALSGKSPVTSTKIEKIISTLTFDDQKARERLGWKPRPVLDAFRTR